jgi:hypothetical protein
MGIGVGDQGETTGLAAGVDTCSPACPPLICGIFSLGSGDQAVPPLPCPRRRVRGTREFINVIYEIVTSYMSYKKVDYYES